MKMERFKRGAWLALMATVVPGPVYALADIPETDGLSGFVTLGVSNTHFSNNLVAGTDMGDVGIKRIDSLAESPDSESLTSGFFSGELNYTFAETRTQLFLGNSLEDLVRYDFTFQAGVRQEVADLGILSGALLFSGFPTNVWADPYVTGEAREKTDRDSSGGRIGWAKVMGSGLELNLSHREINLEQESSGEFLNLSASDQALLDREGNHLTLDASYHFNLGQGHSLAPRIKYHDIDLDGKAMNQDRYDLELAYGYRSRQFSLVSTLYYANADYDEINPIYNKVQDVDSYGASLSGFYHRPFDLEGWSAMASLAAAKSDSNIDFYDADIVQFNVGMMYRF